MFKVVLTVLVLSLSAAQGKHQVPDNVILTENEASSFIDREKRWWWPSLEEECYHESLCSWEEVEEQKGNNEPAWEYYHAVLCTRTGAYCKECTTRHSCDTNSWSQWSAYGSKNGNTCYNQNRFKAFKHSTVTEKKPYNCDSVLKCGSEPSESRSWCECTKTECSLENWTPWLGDIPDATCGVQTRSRDYIASTSVAERQDNCDGIPTSCPVQERETRQMCSCQYQEDCTVKEWGSWSEEIPELGCGVQIRKREYNETMVVVQAESCEGFIPCPVNLQETRPMCNCRYPTCDWSDWVEVRSDEKCTIYERYHNKTTGSETSTQSTCDELPTTCNTADVRKEEKDECENGGNIDIKTEPTAPPTDPPTPEPKRGFPSQYIPIGCYRDRGRTPRVLPIMYKNMRKKINWKDMPLTVKSCAEAAAENRFEYFAVQYYGECWSGPDAATDYYALGLAKDKSCWNGVGGKFTNFVYKLVHLPECSDQLEFTTEHSSGETKRGTWCAGKTDEYQWMQAKFDEPKKLSGIATQGDRKDSSYVTVYTVQYSNDGEKWETYLENGDEKLFSGNTDSHTLEINWLNRDITTQYVRLKPSSWSTNNICMTVRFFGCD